MNIPNSLTLGRIFLVPFLVVVLLTRMENFELWGVAILLGAALTDWLDGFVARRRRQVTPLGVVLDPIADKFLIAAAFITLVELDLAPAWMVVIIIGREVLVIGLRAVAAAQGFSVPVSDLGKIRSGQDQDGLAGMRRRPADSQQPVRGAEGNGNGGPVAGGHLRPD
jgi:CDP-diacylglycerol--glycerol-3-phosphate 3-phosphatidyltransferase